MFAMWPDQRVNSPFLRPIAAVPITPDPAGVIEIAFTLADPPWLTPVDSTNCGLTRKDGLDLCRELEAPVHVQLWWSAPWIARLALEVEVVGKLEITLFGPEAPLQRVFAELPWVGIEFLRFMDPELAIGSGLPHDFEEL